MLSMNTCYLNSYYLKLILKLSKQFKTKSNKTQYLKAYTKCDYVHCPLCSVQTFHL